jgi:hypothetical protein
MVGDSGVILITTLFDVPPPGLGFVTVTFNIPSGNSEGNATWICVAVIDEGVSVNVPT